MTEKLMQETEKNDFPKRTRSLTLIRHWKIGLLVVCLLAGVYIFWMKFGESESRAVPQRPVSGALEQVGDRVSSVVFLDAFVPENGQKSLDTASDFSRKGLLDAMAKGEASRAAPKAEVFHVNPKDRAWVDSKLTAQPVGVALQPIKLAGAREKVAKKTYIRAPAYPQPHFDQYFAAKKADPGWRTYEVDGGHDVMVDRPERLVEIFLEVS